MSGGCNSILLYPAHDLSAIFGSISEFCMVMKLPDESEPKKWKLNPNLIICHDYKEGLISSMVMSKVGDK